MLDSAVHISHLFTFNSRVDIIVFPSIITLSHLYDFAGIVYVPLKYRVVDEQ